MMITLVVYSLANNLTGALRGPKELKMKNILLGLALGIALPFLGDYILFGTPTPCHSVEVYEDGSSLQHCDVRQ